MKRKKENLKYHKVATIYDLYFYTLYNFKSIWIAGITNKKISSIVKRKFQINISKYQIVLKSEELVHIFKGHFRDPNNKQLNVSINDLKNIQSIVNYCDEVEDATRKGITALKFIKKFPKGLFTLVVIIDNQNKRLLGKTFWIKA